MHPPPPNVCIYLAQSLQKFPFTQTTNNNDNNNNDNGPLMAIEPGWYSSVG